MRGGEVISLYLHDSYLIETRIISIKMNFNGGSQTVLGDLFYLSDLPSMLIVGIEIVSWFEFAIKIIGFEL